MAEYITIVQNQAELETQFAFVNSVVERYRSSAISMVKTAALQMNWEIRHQGLKTEELRRCIVNQTFSSLMDKGKCYLQSCWLTMKTRVSA